MLHAMGRLLARPQRTRAARRRIARLAGASIRLHDEGRTGEDPPVGRRVGADGAGKDKRGAADGGRVEGADEAAAALAPLLRHRLVDDARRQVDHRHVGVELLGLGVGHGAVGHLLDAERHLQVVGDAKRLRVPARILHVEAVDVHAVLGLALHLGFDVGRHDGRKLAVDAHLVEREHLGARRHLHRRRDEAHRVEAAREPDRRWQHLDGLRGRRPIL
mmetsp:Transcript_13399/g.34129  ORF Transcript_13399/g.34129 Transcript_13399/m.34129 type:complete len:218 (-) Transcript_13399:1764-2417(-)